MQLPVAARRFDTAFLENLQYEKTRSARCVVFHIAVRRSSEPEQCDECDRAVTENGTNWESSGSIATKE